MNNPSESIPCCARSPLRARASGRAVDSKLRRRVKSRRRMLLVKTTAEEPLLRPLPLGAIRAEVNIDLHAHGQRCGIGEIDDHFENVDVRLFAWTARVDSTRRENLSDRRDLSDEFAAAKRGRAYQSALTDPNLDEVALVQFRTHPQCRQIAEH